MKEGSYMLYEKLDYVIAIAEDQNLTRAAKKLYISQPTLTMYLNRLEESLGVQLFDRRKNPVLLTPAGKHYIEKMREIAEAEQILRGELRTVSDPARTFRIGSARVRGHYWLPPLLRLLSERHPETFFTVSLGAEKQLQKLLGKDSIDMAIGSLADIPESDIPLVFEDVALERTLLVAHRKYGLVPPEEHDRNSPDSPYLIDPVSLQNLPFITPSSANGMYLNFQKMIAQFNIKPGHTLVIDTMTTGLQMTVQGLGVQMISAGILCSLTSEERKELDYIQLPDFPVTRKCSVVWREDTEQMPLIEEAIQLLRENVLPQMIYTEVIRNGS
jgi:DNA-binding transcriptional LysR family regulator